MGSGQFDVSFGACIVFSLVELLIGSSFVVIVLLQLKQSTCGWPQLLSLMLITKS